MENINIGTIIAQIINFAVVFWLFKKFLSKPITKLIDERRSLIKRLEHADEAYDERILEAEAESKKIVQEGLHKKDQLIAEAGSLANQKKEQILEEAKLKSERVLTDAKVVAESMKEELATQFETGVKKTSLLVIKKLLTKDKNLQSSYLDEVVKEVTS